MTTYESFVLRKDGTKFPIEINVRSGKIVDNDIRVVCIRDISERRLAEDKLRNSEKRFKSLMEQSPLSITIYDDNGLQVEANESFQNLWSIDRQKTIGKYN